MTNSRFPLPASSKVPYHELRQLEWICDNIWDLYRKGWISEQRWLAETKEVNHIYYNKIRTSRRDYYDKYLHPDILIDFKMARSYDYKEKPAPGIEYTEEEKKKYFSNYGE